MNSLLTDICNKKKKEIEALKLKCSLKSLQKLIGNLTLSKLYKLKRYVVF